MIGKTDWTRYLHLIRKEEIELVFNLLLQKHFVSGLEIGAGDGFQTTLLASHVDKLISSDLNFKRIKESLKISGVEYRVIDADSIEGCFGSHTFDLIFSSNVLEHLCDSYQFLNATQAMLVNHGYAVHIVPSRHIKISYLLFYYPNLAYFAVERLLGKFRGEPFFQGANINFENNINATSRLIKDSGRLRKFLFPSVHGNFSSHREEFIAFGKNQWERLFIEAGYSIFAYAKGPVFSGYGFGLNLLRKLLEHLGVSSEHIFVLKKMSKFESDTWIYIKKYLSHGSFYERKKFVKDWLKKKKAAKAFFNDFINAVGHPGGKKVLDIGFGNGIMLLEFARAGACCYGVETEEYLFDMAKRRFKKNNLQAILKIYDGKILPFASSTFDCAYSTSVLEHMSHPEIVLSEIARTLVSGGKFYLSFPNKYAPKESHTGLWFISWLPRFLTQYILKLSKSSPLEDWNLHFISFFSLKKMAENAGLRIVYDTHSHSHIKRFIKNALASCGVHYGVLLKTIIIVLEKPIN